MTEGRNPQMARSTTERDAGVRAEDGWGATTNTAGAAATPTAETASGRSGAKLGRTANPAKGAVRGGAGGTESNPRSARVSPKSARQPRRARLTLSHVSVYSVFKFSCVLAIALFFVWLIVVGLLYGILDVAGALDKVNSTVQTINGDGSKPVISGSLVFGAAIIIGAANIVLFIALATVGALIYNLCADLVGGVELTLSERE